MRIAVIGAGGWGTALSIAAARAGHHVRLWSRNTMVVESINRERVNAAYLDGLEIPSSVEACIDLKRAVDDAGMLILAAPSHALREVLTSLSGATGEGAIFVGAAKGIEVSTGMRVSEVVADVLGPEAANGFVCLSGPSFAREMAADHPTAVVAAGTVESHARLVQETLSVGNFRIYTNSDVIGVELGGAVKNVMALAAGMVSGLGLGSNSVAALITRGLAEMTRLALACGARAETLMGLAGLGDLVLTCTGTLSRNRFVGHELGRGRSLADVLAGMNEVAEGVRTTEAVRTLAARHGVETPIAEEVYSVLYEGKGPREAVESLMSRPLKGEFEREQA